MWVAFYHTEIQNESSKNAENWFTNVSALKIEKSKIRHSPLAHIHQWVERPHGVTGGCVGSLHWPILTINFSPNIFGECQENETHTFSSMTQDCELLPRKSRRQCQVAFLPLCTCTISTLINFVKKYPPLSNMWLSPSLTLLSLSQHRCSCQSLMSN